jgi:hypothetical protein
LRALQGRGTLRVPDTGREASRPYNRNHLWPTFYEIINSDGFVKNSCAGVSSLSASSSIKTGATHESPLHTLRFPHFFPGG